MAARAPLCSLIFRYSQTEQNKGALAREDKPRAKTIPVNRREHLAPTVGHDIKHQSRYTSFSVPVLKAQLSQEGSQKSHEHEACTF